MDEGSLTPRGSAPLRNPKHEKFALAIADHMIPAEAYEYAGLSPNGAKQSAHRLLSRVDVCDRIAYLQRKIADQTVERTVERNVATRDWILEKLCLIVEKCTGEERWNPSGARGALELLGRAQGLWIDRTDSRVQLETDPAKYTESQVVTLAERQAALAGQLRAQLESAGIAVPPPESVQ